MYRNVFICLYIDTNMEIQREGEREREKEKVVVDTQLID